MHLLDFIYPPQCVVCEAPTSVSHTLCAACFCTLPRIDAPLCGMCGYPLLDEYMDQRAAKQGGADIYDSFKDEVKTPPNSFHKRNDISPAHYGGDGAAHMHTCASCITSPLPFMLRSSLVYDSPSKDLILQFKHCDRLDLSPFFARFLYYTMQPYIQDIDVIIPVPLHWWRHCQRGYNQSALLAYDVIAYGVSQNMRMPELRFKDLVRTRHTQPQGHLSARARQRNTQGVFSAAANVKNKTIALIDDVYTSGATIRACTHALKKAGALRVIAFTLARVLKGRDAFKG